MADLLKLREIPLFADLHKAELEAIAGIIDRVSFPRGERIFSEGDAGDAMFLIERGRVRISRTMPGLGEEALAILGPGAVFGEMAVLDGGRRSADAVVHDDAELLTISRDALESLLFLNKELAYYVLGAMVRTLAGRLREMDEKLMTVFVMARFC